MTAGRFPVRVAAVDIGSNAIRFLAAELAGPAAVTELESRREPVRLGHDAFRTGRLRDDRIEAAVDALVRFRARMDALRVTRHRAVATSAVRDSENGGELVERARREADIRVQTITGAEEARLVWLAVRARAPLEGRWALADLGGGSLEVTVVTAAGPEWSESLDVGTVRLLEDIEATEDGEARDHAPGNGEGDGRDEAASARRVEAYARRLRIGRLAEERVRGLVATGGNIEALAELAGAEPDAAGVSRLARRDLRDTARRLSRMTYRKRIRSLGLRPDRADVIVPAAFIYDRVAELAGADEIIVPNVGVKDGVLLDLGGGTGTA